MKPRGSGSHPSPDQPTPRPISKPDKPDSSRVTYLTDEQKAALNAKYGYHLHLLIGEETNETIVMGVLKKSHIYLDTCTKNGLNIAALQFVLLKGSQQISACCVLSEFSGASRALIGALRVNPWSAPNVCEQLDK